MRSGMVMIDAKVVVIKLIEKIGTYIGVDGNMAGMGNYEILMKNTWADHFFSRQDGCTELFHKEGCMA